MSHEPGKLYVISAPSGAGKTTIVHRVMALQPNLKFSISYTTRKPRDGEIDTRDYFFLDLAEFERMRDADEFLEFAEVFGNYYGTGRQSVKELRELGHDVLLEIDWQGARQVRSRQPDCCSIFILPPSLSELEHRLRGRGTESDAAIRKRLDEAVDDMSHWREFDHVVINDQIESAIASLQAIMSDQPSATGTGDPELCKQVETLLAAKIGD